MFTRIISLIIKEFLQTFRDPRMKFTLFVAPVVQLFIFGYAATMDITNIPTAVYDLDNTKQSRDVTRLFSYSKYFDIQKYLTEESQINDVMNGSDIKVILRFNRGFAQDLTSNMSAQLQEIIDGTDSNAAQIILGYTGTIIGNYNFRILRQRAETFLNRKDICPQIDLRERRWFNENLESKNFYLPGVIAMIVSIMSLVLTSMAIVREKEIGTMEQLMVSPIKPIELILGKIVPFGIICFAQVVMITLVGVFWFKIPMRGSLFLLFVSTLFYLFTTLGVGLFISTISSTQQEAMMSVFLFNFPMTLLSGFAYPIANMPKIIQFLTIFNPQRYYLTIIRYIFLKGVGIEVLWGEMVILLLFGIVVISISSLRFQKNLG